MANEPKHERKPASTTAEDEQPKKPEKAPGQSNRMIFFAVLGLVIVLNAVIAVVLVRVTMPKPDAPVETGSLETDSMSTQKEELEEPGFSEPPLEAVVNIKGGEDMHFLKIVVVFLFDQKKYKDLGGELKQRMPEIKDIIIDRLAARSLEDLQRPNARDEIRAELKRLINQRLSASGKGRKDDRHIADVLINEFIIQ